MGHGGVSDPCQTVCEQIWRFLKVLGDKSSLKSNPIVRRLFWAIFEEKSAVATFIKHLGYLLIQHLVTLD